jgi:uncharacterized protein
VSADNLDTVQRVYEAWNSDEGMPALLSLWDTDVEFVNPGSAIEGGTHQGHAGLVKAIDALDAAFVDYRHDPEELIELGDKVMVLVTFRARGRDSGVPVEISEQHVWTLRDGKIIRFQWFHDEASAKQAAREVD